ncbi:MAG: acyl carrier protein [Armatimonadetes bacterium]|nr:acyl carrier protein [Armatimonadota bacterium]
MDPEFVDRMRAALAQVTTVDVGPLTADRSIRELGLDSVTLAELLLTLEETEGITIEQTDIERMKTLGDLQGIILRLRAESAV